MIRDDFGIERSDQEGFYMRFRATRPSGFPVGVFLGAICVVLAIGGGAAPTRAAPLVRDWKTVRIGIDTFDPPFSTIDPEQGPAGFDVAIAKTLCDRMKVHCEFVPATRDALVADLLARRSDAVVASLPMTDDLRRTVDFTDRYHSSSGRFVTTAIGGLTDTSPESLRNKAVGALAGSRFATYLNDAYGPHGTIVKLYKTETEAYADLREGRISAYFGSAIRLYHWFSDGTGGRCCRFVGPDVRNPHALGNGAGIAVRKEDGDLRDMFNKALADILRDGTYEKVNAAYFTFLIY